MAASSLPSTPSSRPTPDRQYFQHLLASTREELLVTTGPPYTTSVGVAITPPRLGCAAWQRPRRRPRSGCRRRGGRRRRRPRGSRRSERLRAGRSTSVTFLPAGSSSRPSGSATSTCTFAGVCSGSAPSSCRMAGIAVSSPARRKAGARASPSSSSATWAASAAPPATSPATGLRRGHATTAARNGASERTIMRTTGHTSTQTVRGYIEDGALFSDPAAKYLRRYFS